MIYFSLEIWLNSKLMINFFLKKWYINDKLLDFSSELIISKYLTIFRKETFNICNVLIICNQEIYNLFT